MGATPFTGGTIEDLRSCGVASHYGMGDGFHGRMAADGSIFNRDELTAAHRTLPFGTKLLVENRENGKVVTVTITDRGPFIEGRSLDLSYGAFGRLADPAKGLMNFCYRIV